MRTSNPRIYAGGDCASEGMQLTPVAALQGEVAASNILKENSIEADYTGIPSAIHTIKANDRIIGAYILGPGAGEVINIFAAIVRLGLKVSDIKKLVFAYPTSCSDIPNML